MRFNSLSLPKTNHRSSFATVKLGKLAMIACYCLGSLSTINAQNTPAEKEDATEERLKILRASDQIEIIQANSDKIQVELANLKEQLAKQQESDTALHQEINALKSALQKSEEARAKEREVLLAKVGEMIASAAPKPAPPEPKKEPKEKESAPAPSHDSEKGYTHTVEKGQTLSMIATAYSEKGVKVTVDDIRKANNLGSKDVLKVGQKLFIPKK